MTRRSNQPPLPPETKRFSSTDEIDAGIRRIQRRLTDLADLDILAARRERNGRDDAVISDIVETLRDIFGPNSPEFREHEHLHLWAGPMGINMPESRIDDSREKGRAYISGILQGLIKRLEERRVDLLTDLGGRPPAVVFKDLDLHPRIRSVAERLVADGHYWEAVFNASRHSLI